MPLRPFAPSDNAGARPDAAARLAELLRAPDETFAKRLDTDAALNEFLDSYLAHRSEAGGDALAAVGPPGGPFAPVEATTWDGTVDALGSVEGDRVELVVKRLVKRPVTWITVKHPNGEKPDERHRVYAGENLRRALLTRKVALNDPLARRFDDNMVGGDCGSGGACCTCAVAVMNGGDLLSEQKASERQIMKTLRQPRFRLACKTSVGADLKNNEEGELTILVNPRQQEA